MLSAYSKCWKCLTQLKVLNSHSRQRHISTANTQWSSGNLIIGKFTQPGKLIFDTGNNAVGIAAPDLGESQVWAKQRLTIDNLFLWPLPSKKGMEYTQSLAQCSLSSGPPPTAGILGLRAPVFFVICLWSENHGSVLSMQTPVYCSQDWQRNQD